MGKFAEDTLWENSCLGQDCL